jgi:hypothetical protein
MALAKETRLEKSSPRLLGPDAASRYVMVSQLC